MMRSVTGLILLTGVMCLFPVQSDAQVEVPNRSFEEGDDTPESWTLSGGDGNVVSPGAEGRRAISVAGDGKSTNGWLSPALPLSPDTVYRLRFQARRLQGSSGLPTSGPPFCNRDLTSLGAEWTAVESYFRTPSELAPDAARLRFGQWEVDGAVAFDAVQLVPVTPIYQVCGDVKLGEGERLEGNRYTFVAPFGQDSANHARTLADHRCYFNSNRWVLDESSTVTYRHDVERLQQEVRINAAIGWYVRGELVVSVSPDGRLWTEIGTRNQQGSVQCKVPDSLLPARAIWVRLTARRSAGDAQPPELQVNEYGYESTTDGPPVDLVGATHFAALWETDPKLQVTISDLGEAIPGGRNVATLSLRNMTDKVLSLDIGGRRCQLPAGGSEKVTAPYTLNAGRNAVRIQVTGEARFAAETTIDVPSLHATDYGHVLPASSAEVGLWWCSSGWKVGHQRPIPPPETQTPALRIAAAANEAEAAQLILRPARALDNLTLTASSLAGPDGSAIDASHLDILRVRYLSVTRPTDASSVVGLWPDPLPPIAGPLSAAPERNLPLWVRVRVPPNQVPGTYRGTITLTAAGYRAEVPLEVDVYGFSLPDHMTCQTAFGFDPSAVWRYHGVETEEHRRHVLDTYLQCLADHHISPNDPAPLDRLQVTWDKQPAGSAPQPVVDFTAWDRAMQRAIDQYHFNTFMLHVPGLGGGTFHERIEPELLGHAEHTPEYQAAMRAYLETVEKHLRDRGWLDEAFVYWFDEPDPKDYEFVNNGFAKLKKWAPDIRRMLTEQVEEALIGGPNIWCPLTPSYDAKVAAERRQAGEEFWWYICTGPKAPYCTLFIDHPGTELRVWLWQTWQRRIDGVLIWQTNYWTSSAAYPDPAAPQNPYEDPMGWVSGYSTPAGVRQPWGNGDGRFLYPPESAADGRPAAPVLEGAVSSIRLEMLRDGIEDYEYLAVLQRRIDARRATLTAEQVAHYTALLDVPPTITSDLTTFTRDPAPIEERRETIARAIEELSH